MCAHIHIPLPQWINDQIKTAKLKSPPKTFLIEPLLGSKVNETCKLERKGKGEKWYNLISATSTRKGITEN